VVVFINITEIPSLIAMIVKGAFGLDQVIGGTFGAAVMMGIKRGLFSSGILLSKAKKRIMPNPLFTKKLPILENNWPKSLS